MKIYQVVDDGEVVMVTDSEITALRLLRKLSEKHDVTWCWIDDEVLR